jgi:hypothetical protein
MVGWQSTQVPKIWDAILVNLDHNVGQPVGPAGIPVRDRGQMLCEILDGSILAMVGWRACDRGAVGVLVVCRCTLCKDGKLNVAD